MSDGARRGGYSTSDGRTQNVRSLAGSKPNGAARNRRYDSVIKPLPASSISANAVSKATIAERAVRRRGEAPTVAFGAPSLRSRDSSRPWGSSAGSAAHNSDASTLTPTANAKKRRSTRGSANAPILPYMFRGAMSRAGSVMNGSSAAARIAPATPPARLRSAPSLNTSRARSHRVAPSADRIASSRRRPSARAMSKFATFAHASNKRNATAPNNSNTH